MSMRTMAASSPKSASASVRASSVLPTPVGPRNRKLPMGRFGSESPARARLIASATASTASSWPTTRSCSCSSRRMRRSRSSSVSWLTGMPVALETRSFFEFFFRNRLILLALHAPQLVLQRLCVLGLGLRTEPDPGSRLIHEVYSLVGQETACDVAVRKLGSRDDGFLPYLHPVVRLVAVLETPQDVYGVLACGLADEYRLEAPLKGCVLLYVLAVLVDGGRADDVQLAAGESWFEHVRGVHRALGRSGAYDRVQFVDEEDQVIRVLPHLVYDLLEALLELAPVLGACHDA